MAGPKVHSFLPPILSRPQFLPSHQHPHETLKVRLNSSLVCASFAWHEKTEFTFAHLRLLAILPRSRVAEVVGQHPLPMPSGVVKSKR